MSEIWKAVPGLPTYEASDQGRVRRQGYYIDQGCKHGGTMQRYFPPITLSQSVSQNGYHRVAIVDEEGRHRLLSVHSLVMLAFIGPLPFEAHERRHLDDNKDNNVPANLAYGTRVENKQDSLKNGTMVHSEKSPGAKLKRADVWKIRALRGKVRQIDLAARFGVCQAVISAIQLRRCWKHV